MYRNIAIAGATVVAIAGVGTAALAASGSDSTSGSGTTATTQHAKDHHGKGKHHGRRDALRHAVHGSFVTKGKDGYVTHDGIRGVVTAVSPTSITVKASDGYTETFSIGSKTKVRMVTGTKGDRHGTASSIGAVKDGADVAVLGSEPESSHANPTATVVVDGVRLAKK